MVEPRQLGAGHVRKPAAGGGGVGRSRWESSRESEGIAAQVQPHDGVDGDDIIRPDEDMAGPGNNQLLLN